VILSIDGKPTPIAHSAMNQIAHTRPGETVRIELMRSGKPLLLSAEVGRREPEADGAGG